jgi:hypothetical protein
VWGGGRPRDPIWEKFTVADGVVTCHKCDKVIHMMDQTHVERVRLHFAKTCTKYAGRGTITMYFPAGMASLEQDVFALRLAQWTYATGVSFIALSRSLLQQVVELLSPSAKVPSRWAVVGPLLDRVYDESITEVMRFVVGSRYSLTTDGWADINGNSVFNYMLLVGKNTFLLESNYTCSTSHDADFLATDIERVITKYSLGAPNSVVTDNTAVNKAM